MIFIDSDAFIAIEVEKDIHHEKAKKLLDVIEKESFVTSWQVIDEVTTKISYFSTKKRAEEFLRKVIRSDTKIEFVDAGFIKMIEETFRKQTSKRVSLTDCTNMVIAKSLGIDIFFSFDDHYVRNGFELLRVD